MTTISKMELDRIARGFYNYTLANFKYAKRLGYLQVLVEDAMNSKEGSKKLVVCLGAGWCNTPWHEDLVKFLDCLIDRVKVKYPFITSNSLCGYAGSPGAIKFGGLIDEEKLTRQMMFPEKY